MAVKRNKSRKATHKVTLPGLTPLQKSLLDEAGRKVTTASEGRQQEVSIEQVVTRKLLQVAANGSVHALSNAVNEIILAQRINQREIDEDVEFGNRLKTHQQKLLDRASSEGKDPNTVLPHPDDIEVIPGVGFKVHGPWDEAELKIVLSNCARRDLYILQAALEERLLGPEMVTDEPSSEASKGGSAILMAQFFNHGLPDRFEKSNIEIIMDLSRLGRLTKRELLKATYAAWASLGRPKPRGWVTPPFQEARAQMELLADGCAELLRDSLASKVSSDRDIADRLQRLFRRVRR